MIASSIAVAIFIMRLFDSDDGSGTMLAVVLAGAFLLTNAEPPTPVQMAQQAAAKIADKISQAGARR
jgi:hypothetical protein